MFNNKWFSILLPKSLSVCGCWGGKQFSAGIEGQDWKERIKLVLKDSVDHVDLVGKSRNSLESFDLLEARVIISHLHTYWCNFYSNMFIYIFIILKTN